MPVATMKFLTADGYALFLVGGEWVDSLDPEAVDMRFTAGPDGLPTDSLGDPLPGRLTRSEAPEADGDK
jgi:hypothetical protein